jgi:DNA-binding transcriptional LysR family regulator
MKLDNLNLFVKTLQSGSVTQAAKDIGMAKSSLSRHLSDLEKEFNIRLLDRRPRNLAATEAGQLLYDQVAPLMEGLDEVSNFMEHWREQPRGALSMLLPMEFFNEDMGQLAIEFMEKYKDIQLTINHYSGQLPEHSRTFDLCFVVHDRPLPPSDMIARSLMSLPQDIYVSPHCANRMNIQSLHHLSQQKAIVQSGETDWHFRGQEGAISIPVSARLIMNSEQMRIMGAVRGMGMIKLPRYVAEHQVKLGALQRVPIPWQLEAQTVSVMYPGRVMPRKARALLEFIQDNIGRLRSQV